jgi:hypothetical protein
VRNAAAMVGSCGEKQESEKLFIFFLMAILPQAFFTFVRSNFMTLSFLTTGHRVSILMNKLVIIFLTR